MSRGGGESKGKTFYDLMDKERADQMTIAALTSKLERIESFLYDTVQELNGILGLNDKVKKGTDPVDLSVKVSSLVSTLCGLYNTSEAEHKKVLDKLSKPLAGHNARLIGNILKCSDDQRNKIGELIGEAYRGNLDEKTLTKSIVKAVSKVDKSQEEELFKIASNIVASRSSFIRAVECKYVVDFDNVIRGNQ